MSRLFDNYIMVDWSAAAKPNNGADSIWIGVLRRDVRLQLRFEEYNPKTRIEAFNKITEILEALNKRGDKTLLGFDFCLGFPFGTAKALGLNKEDPHEAIFEFLTKEISDKADNSNNRFSVASKMNRIISGKAFPFWGCPPRDILTTLQPKKSIIHDENTIKEYRICEIRGKVASPVWKLYSPGSVGSQTLTGIPYIKKLQDNFDKAAIWPFDIKMENLNRDNLENYDVIITEIYPSMLKTKAALGEVKDLSQIKSIAEYFANLDETGKLSSLFALPKDISQEQKDLIEKEEGWILGIQ